MTVDPTDVFTPAGSLPPGMFASRSRDALEQRIEDALQESGRHVTLHGWTGVGKTSLIEHVCTSREVSFVHAECNGTFENLMRLTLDRLGVRVTTEVVEGDRVTGEASGGVFGLFMGKASGEQTSQVRYTPYAGPLEHIVVEAMVGTSTRVLFIDNLEDLADDDTQRAGICRLIKSCSARTRDLGSDAPSVVVAGPTSAVQALLRTDDAAARRTEQVEVPRMSAEEVDEILVRGEVKLGISFEDACRHQIIALSDGFPYYAHLYALHCSRVALRAERATVTSEDFDSALAAIIDACLPRFQDAYLRATHTRGQGGLRRGALAALATSDELEVSVSTAQEAFLELHPQYERVERVRFVGRLLNEFRDMHGLLEDAWLDDGQRGYRFRDPLMRVYVRLRALRDRQLADAEWRQSLPS